MKEIIMVYLTGLANCCHSTSRKSIFFVPYPSSQGTDRNMTNDTLFLLKLSLHNTLYSLFFVAKYLHISVVTLFCMKLMLLRSSRAYTSGKCRIIYDLKLLSILKASIYKDKQNFKCRLKSFSLMYFRVPYGWRHTASTKT